MPPSPERGPAESGPGGLHLLPCGDAAVLVELADLRAALALYSELLAEPPAGVVDLVPGARTVLVRVDPAVTGPEAAARAVRAAWAAVRPAGAGPVNGEAPGDGPPGASGRPRPPPVEVAVTYDGPDLAEVARRCGLTEADVVARHAATPWTVAFVGFAPGFGYLAGGDPRLVVPRRDSPRSRVPAGAVGLAGEFSGVYPRESPGGWQLIGRTDVVLFDAGRDPPALLQPGTSVLFRALS